MFTSANPATGVELVTYPEMDSAQVESIVRKAVSGFKSWRRSSLAERQAVLRKIAENFEANKEQLAEMATLEMGKTLKAAIAEIEKCATTFRYYAERGPEYLQGHGRELGSLGLHEFMNAKTLIRSA